MVFRNNIISRHIGIVVYVDTHDNTGVDTYKGIVDGVVSYSDDLTWNYYQDGVSFIFANNTFKNITDGSNGVFYSDGNDLDDYVPFFASLSNTFVDNDVDTGIFVLENTQLHLDSSTVTDHSTVIYGQVADVAVHTLEIQNT